MRKSIAVLALAGAFGTLFADNGPEVANWFTAIGDSPSFEHLNPVNGAWTITPGTDGSAGYADGRLVLELGADGSAVFAATDGTAPDTNTITRVTITTTFEPLTELPNSSDADGDANLVVCGGKFYVWDGGKWVDTDITAPAAGVETEILAEITYQGVNAARAIRFTIGENEPTGWLPLVSTENAFANVTIKGAATLDNIIGQVEMGRAENDGIKYSTIADAKAAAKSGSDKTITLLRDSSEEVEMDSEIELETAGKYTGKISLDPEDANAKIEIAYGKTPSESTQSAAEVKLYVVTDVPVEKINVTVDDASKEVVNLQKSEDGQIKFSLRTSTDVLNQVKPDGVKALKTDPTNPNDKYRQFLSSVAKEAYEAAHANPASIQEAINQEALNGLRRWQNYVMGISVTDYANPVQPVAAPAGDKDEDFITLSVPVINKANESGDYKITYKVANDDGSVTKMVDDPQAIKVPLGTGIYAIQAILSDPED